MKVSLLVLLTFFFTVHASYYWFNMDYNSVCSDPSWVTIELADQCESWEGGNVTCSNNNTVVSGFQYLASYQCLTTPPTAAPTGWIYFVEYNATDCSGLPYVIQGLPADGSCREVGAGGGSPYWAYAQCSNNVALQWRCTDSTCNSCTLETGNNQYSLTCNTMSGYSFQGWGPSSCAASTSTSPSGSTNSEAASSNIWTFTWDPMWIGIIAAAGFLFLVIVIVIIVCIAKRRKSSSSLTMY